MKTMMIAMLLAASTSVAAPPQIDPADLARLDDAFRIAGTFGPRVWPGFTAAGAPVILIRGDFEYLLNCDTGTPGFALLPSQRFRGKPVFVRPRTLPPNLLASFPAIGRDTVVVGTPEATQRTPAYWTLTICHELFHVYQGEHGMTEKVATLAIGPQNDPSWQLDYKFPYNDPRVVNAMHLLGDSIFEALQDEDPYRARVVGDALHNLLDLLSPKDAAYLRFVVLKEGIARYFEYGVAKLASPKTWQHDYEPMRFTIEHLGRVSHSRTEFYALGLGLGLLLDRVDPQWQQAYFNDNRWLDDIYLHAVDEAPPSCPTAPEQAR